MSAPRFAAIILAGGLFTHMEQLKPLLPLCKAMLTDIAVSLSKGLGIDVYLAAGYLW
jgi:molybdopterin-guanine dinucleotide biosynthesis protein A